MDEELRRKLTAFFKTGVTDVECAYLFGSQARGQAGELSDLDTGVLFDESLAVDARLERAAQLVERLEQVTRLRVDVTVLNDAPPALRHRVVRDGRLVWTRDDRRRVAFETRAIQEFLDFEPVLARYDRLLLARAREGRLGA